MRSVIKLLGICSQKTILLIQEYRTGTEITSLNGSPHEVYPPFRRRYSGFQILSCL